jgi:hypothetical protein
MIVLESEKAATAPLVVRSVRLANRNSVQPFSHTHSLLDFVPKALIERNHLGIRRPHLKIHFETATPGKRCFQPPEEGGADPPPLVSPSPIVRAAVL